MKRAARLAQAALFCMPLLGEPAATAQEGVFLSESEAPRAVFADADRFDRFELDATEATRAQMRHLLGDVRPSIWESSYVGFVVHRNGVVIGRAFLVEEIGKHRPITFVVGVRADGHIADVAVVAYRESKGGEIRNKRFLAQYRDKEAAQPLQRGRTITNIAGATLSVDAASRAVKKALALARLAPPAGGAQLARARPKARVAVKEGQNDQ